MPERSQNAADKARLKLPAEVRDELLYRQMLLSAS
jgi:hypothetical protein